MDFRRYSERQDKITTSLVGAVLRVLFPLREEELSEGDWTATVAALFGLIDDSRRESAILARWFFDEQYLQHRTGEPPNIDLPSYFREWLAEDLKPFRESMKAPDTPEATVTKVTQVAMKHTENAGRQTIMQGAENDGTSTAWARVLTGRENCAFCFLLASRGPVYRSKKSAGGYDTSAFHSGCDCKVVPVFDENDWPGRDSYKQVEDLYSRIIDGAKGEKAVLRKIRQYLKDNPNQAVGAI